MATAEQQAPKSSQGKEQGSTGPKQAIERGAPRTSAPTRAGSYAPSPFSVMRRLSEDMDRIFADFFGPSLFRWGDWPERLAWPAGGGTFSPQLELRHQGNKLVIRADLPGMQKDDVRVEVLDNELSISGERQAQSERSEGGYYRSERSYGSFRRSVPLPKGAKPDTAMARFENGVLEIEMEAPSREQGQGRRIEVREGRPH